MKRAVDISAEINRIAERERRQLALIEKRRAAIDRPTKTVRIDDRTVILSKHINLSDHEIIERYNKIRTQGHSSTIGASNGGNKGRSKEQVTGIPEDWSDD
jgi:hypothetical protein